MLFPRLQKKILGLRTRPSPEVFFLHHRDKYEIDVEEPLIATIRNAGESGLAFKLIPNSWIGSCDASYYVNQAKVPSFTFGPGSMAQGHIIDEYIEIEDAINGAKSLALTIYGWCK